MHEFDRVVDSKEVESLKEGDQASKILAKAKQSEFLSYKLAGAFGEKKLLD